MVNTVLIEKIYTVGAQAPEATFDRPFDMRGSAVKTPFARQIESEPGRDLYLVADRF